ncbi:ABC transporter permease [Conexibacter sp. CPCC 206217]|uniref:ABC transporter permease n=1 Tax=Conexibacter sp. CPCC 206217 TaxID=3064574 RepID=UPI00351C2332
MRSDAVVDPIDGRAKASRGGGAAVVRLRTAATTLTLQLAVLALAVLLWWVATDVVPAPQSIAHAFSPEEALPALVSLVRDGTLVEDAATSSARLAIGLGAAALIGIPLGLLVGGVRIFDRATGALFQLLRMTSPLSWTPIAVIALGVGSRPVEALVAAAAIWPIALNTAAGVRAADPDWLLTARALGAARHELLRGVVLPAIRPHVLTGVRLALGVAWIVLVPAEMLGVQSGLGYAVLNARDQLAYEDLMAVIVAIGILGFALDALAQTLLRPRRRRRPASVALAASPADAPMALV